MPSYILEEPQNHIQELVKYKDWIANTVKLMYPYKTTLPNLNSEIDDLITLEIQLAKLVSHNHDRQITTIAALIDQVPNIDWIQLFKILFDGTDISLTENDSVAISILYIKSIVNLLKETKPKTTGKPTSLHTSHADDISCFSEFRHVALGKRVIERCIARFKISKFSHK